jgi:hypothetical protein
MDDAMVGCDIDEGQKVFDFDNRTPGRDTIRLSSLNKFDISGLKGKLGSLKHQLVPSSDTKGPFNLFGQVANLE